MRNKLLISKVNFSIGICFVGAAALVGIYFMINAAELYNPIDAAAARAVGMNPDEYAELYY